MDKLNDFTRSNETLTTSYIETIVVKEGVECDIYKFPSDESKDLALVRVSSGFKTPLQKVIKGAKTVEGYVSGKGTLTSKIKTSCLEPFVLWLAR